MGDAPLSKLNNGANVLTVVLNIEASLHRAGKGLRADDAANLLSSELPPAGRAHFGLGQLCGSRASGGKRVIAGLSWPARLFREEEGSLIDLPLQRSHHQRRISILWLNCTSVLEAANYGSYFDRLSPMR